MGINNMRSIPKIELETKVSKIITEYIELFPEEADAFQRQMKQKKDNLRTKFAELKKSDSVERQIHEIPETLHLGFKGLLTESEYKWIMETKEGARWFAKMFPVFSVPEKI